MTQVILNVEDDKLNAFISFIKTLNYVSLAKGEHVPEWQKEEVLKSILEIENGTSEHDNWENVRKLLFEKHNIK